MKWFASLSLALLVLSFTTAQDDKKDNDKFQGKWNMSKGEMNGEALPEDFVKGFSLTFTKDKFEAKMGDGSGEEGTFKLDTSVKPGKAEFTAGGETRKGIYKFGGDDELHLCVSDKGGETPKDFTGKDGNIFFVLKKAK